MVTIQEIIFRLNINIIFLKILNFLLIFFYFILTLSNQSKIILQMCIIFMKFDKFTEINVILLMKFIKYFSITNRWLSEKFFTFNELSFYLFVNFNILFFIMFSKRFNFKTVLVLNQSPFSVCCRNILVFQIAFFHSSVNIRKITTQPQISFSNFFVDHSFKLFFKLLSFTYT